MTRPDSPSGSRARGWLARVRHGLEHQPPPPAAPVPPEPPLVVLDLLRHLGVALCRAGDTADSVAVTLESVAAAYGATGVRFFVLPTGVFVRIGGSDDGRVDFSPGSSDPLRLDQVDALYRLVDDIRHRRADPATATARLRELIAAPPRFGSVTTILATSVLTLGLGLVLNPTASAVPAYVLLGVLVGAMRWWADRDRLLAQLLSVSTAFVVTVVVFSLSDRLLHAPPLEIVIPALVTLLPGAALTIATVELSTGSMITGSARLVFGLERLLLLTFGIAMGVEVAGLPLGGIEPGQPLGPWAPWLGVLVFGVGQFFASSAPQRTLRWLLLVLYTAYAVQAGSGQLLGALGGSFVAGAVVLPVAYAIQLRPTGPPVLVTFLPAFWLLVPGALGLKGVTEIVGADQASGLGDFLNALLSIVAIAAGVLVGAGLSERTARLFASRGGL